MKELEEETKCFLSLHFMRMMISEILSLFLFLANLSNISQMPFENSKTSRLHDF